MIRIDKVFVRIDEKSRLSLPKVQETLESTMKAVASATNFKVDHRVENNTEQYEMYLELILEKPISLHTANKILNSFTKERIIIRKLTWERKLYGAFKRGHLEIVVF